MTSTPHDADHAFAYAYAYVQQSTSTRKSSAQGPTPTSDKRKLIEIQIRRFLACPKEAAGSLRGAPCSSFTNYETSKQIIHTCVQLKFNIIDN